MDYAVTGIRGYGRGPAAVPGGRQFLPAYPQKDSKENVGNIGIGGTGHFAYRMGQSPFLVGFAAGFWIYGQRDV
ncbi:MAG: hypothetical protein MZV49_00505 [Rhodopseudomonas palustris]|nr:hypothetical protein [Rhodopseudomonas palustris]